MYNGRQRRIRLVPKRRFRFYRKPRFTIKRMFRGRRRLIYRPKRRYRTFNRIRKRFLYYYNQVGAMPMHVQAPQIIHEEPMEEEKAYAPPEPMDESYAVLPQKRTSLDAFWPPSRKSSRSSSSVVNESNQRNKATRRSERLNKG